MSVGQGHAELQFAILAWDSLSCYMVHLLYFKNVTGLSLEPKLSLPLRFTNVRRPRVVQVSVCRNTRGDHLSFLREAGQLGPISTALAGRVPQYRMVSISRTAPTAQPQRPTGTDRGATMRLRLKNGFHWELWSNRRKEFCFDAHITRGEKKGWDTSTAIAYQKHPGQDKMVTVSGTHPWCLEWGTTAQLAGTANLAERKTRATWQWPECISEPT